MSEYEGLGLPPGWSASPLGEIAGINPPLDRCVVSDDTEVTFVPMRAVAAEGGGLVAPETRRYGEVKKGYTSFLSSDVIMAKITPCTENGKTTVVPEVPGQVCFGSTEFHTIRPEQGVQAEWIEKFLLQHETRRLAQRSMTGGVGQMRVPGEFLSSIRIPIAPSNEQARIVSTLEELLSDLDGGTAALEKARDRLKLYRASVLKAAVEGALTADWRARHPHPQVEPASELLKRILVERRRRWEKDQLRHFEDKGKVPTKNWKAKYREPVAVGTDALPALPHGWCWASFDQMGDTQGGLQKSPARTPRRNHFPYLRVANVHRGSLDLSNLHQFELTPDELKKLRLAPGDILIVEGNGSRREIGRCALWLGEVADCVHQNHIIRVRPSTGLIPKYMDIFLNSPTGQIAIQNVASSTSGLYTLSVGKVKRLPLALPPEDEQEAVVEITEAQLSAIDRLESDLDVKLTHARSLRQSILRHAFAGRLLPQDPNDEPASELLKRIAAEREARAREDRSAQRKGSSSRRRRR